LDLAGGTALIIRRLIVPLTVAALAVHAGLAFAQGAFPAPQAGPSEECTKDFAPLRQEAEQRGKLIKAASERHAPPDEACKLIASFGQSEIKMIKYIESRAAACGISPQISEQLKTGHKSTENMQKIVCAVAQRVQHRGPSGPVGDFWTLPEAQL
jgi:hypothetical protein